ncbi:MAG: hypothetical protein WBK55_05915 [Alphaproteobacteria bacterium]
MKAASQIQPRVAQNPYIPHALNQMPRLLSRMDREAPSRTYGSLDRTFWAWKFTDFSGARFQEALYALTWFYRSPGNDYYQNPLVLDWIGAGFQYWQSLQHADGSFDEAYPFERSLAATAFTSFYLGEAYLRFGNQFPADLKKSVQKTFEKSGDWLCRNDEHHGVLSNHLAAAAAALEIMGRVTNESRFADRSKYFIRRILSRQSSEGWYEEYGGADFGYQTHGTFYLARIWQLTKNEELLESLKRSAQFIAHFMHPNGTLGGEYGSRNTSFYFPAGYEILAPVCPEAASIAHFMRSSVENQNAAGLAMMDAYNFCPLLNNYLFAADVAAERANVAPLPFQAKQGHHEFPRAGLVIHVTEKYQAVFAPSKGGILKIYDKTSASLAFSDCGYWASLKNGKRISSQSFTLNNQAEYGSDAASVKADFAYIKQTVMSPFLFLAFRSFMLTIGRQKNLALFIKNLLVKVLVKGRKTLDVTLERRITFSEDSVTVEDTLTPSKTIEISEFQLDMKFSTIHMGSARYYQPEELEPIKLEPVAGNNRKFIWTAA